MALRSPSLYQLPNAASMGEISMTTRAEVYHLYAGQWGFVHDA